MIAEIDGFTFAGMINTGVKNLNMHVAKVNDLNVFPIPDGDTGDNMMMTLKGGSLRPEVATDNIALTADKVAKGMLLSARGNSGVILSQFFAGIADGFEGKETADSEAMGYAFSQGVKRAYESVMVPTEGTILTVAKEATKAACEAQTEDTVGFLESFVSAAKDTLNRTPEMLSVLKEAGVVDSGGAGLVYIAEGMRSYLTGEEIEGTDVVEESKTTPAAVNVELFGPDSVLEFGYCTELLLRLQTSKTDVEGFDVNIIKDYLSTVGDSIVCLKTDSIVKLHVHTMTPQKVLEFCQQYGEFLTVKIENMMLQHNEVEDKKLSAAADNADISKAADTKPRSRFGVISVAPGEGIRDAFLEFGSDEVIMGGQSMNPSAEDFIEAFERVNADDIFVLPNNKNIILAATQAGKMFTSSTVHVIPTAHVGDAYSVLSMLDTTSNDADTIEELMKEAMEGVETVEITRSVRDTSVGGMKIKKDDHIAILGKDIVATDAGIVETACHALDKLNLSEHYVLILIKGKDGLDGDAEIIGEYAKKLNPYIEIQITDGMQDIYPFYIVAE